MAQEDEWFTIRKKVYEQYKQNIGSYECWRADDFEELYNWLKEELIKMKTTCCLTGGVYQNQQKHI